MMTIVMWVIGLGWLGLLTIWILIVSVRLAYLEIYMGRLKKHPWLVDCLKTRHRDVPLRKTLKQGEDGEWVECRD